ncbi:hypothetical protein SEPCBS57363_003674 [Sporothrix epigloea]|uniref:Uncharacterized protein n=1 Tax=Sporothrix epigloea TaxID=1892477 RepID=A0ABP0DMR7_9PEZI
MSGFSNVLKNGWHPEKGQDFKKQVTGIWKKDDSSYEARANHISRPLSSLRDPASFGPPPRHVALDGGANPNSTAVVVQSSAYPSASSPSQYAPATPARHALPSRQQAAPASDEDEERSRSPQPFRIDTTGLSTSHLPPPPTRQGGSSVSRSPVPTAPPSASRPVPNPSAKAAPPGLPPRLPPRSTPSPNLPTVHGIMSTSAHPPPQPRPVQAYAGPGAVADRYINQEAVNRLGRAGISVPGLGIESAAGHNGKLQQQSTALSAINTLAASPSRITPAGHTAQSPRQTSPTRAPTASQASPAVQLGELQARFAKMGTIAGTAGGRMPSQSPVRPTVESGRAMASLVAGKKKPPPPPAKKPGLAGVAAKPHHDININDDDDDDEYAPPPIPMATRPQGW